MDPVGVAETDTIVLETDTTVVLSDSVGPLTPGPDTTLVCIEIRGSLYSSLAEVCGEEAEILGAHCVRAMWWDLDPWEDLIAGDSLRLIRVGQPPGRENRVIALRYTPLDGSANEPFSVYLFHKEGDNFPSFFYPGGREVTPLLSSMPVSTFEEVTGIYGEPRGDHTHHGVDFKAPLGTPVRSVRGGSVVDVDWNTDYNGHCVKLDIGGGYREIFVHLDEVDPSIHVGTLVPAGGVVGTVGSTGRSSSPHLHYQIDDANSGYSIDPYLFLGETRRELSGSELTRFQSLVNRCDRLMSAAPETP